MSEQWVIPTHINEALCTGDVEVARQWVVSQDLSTRILSVLLWHAAKHTTRARPNAIKAKLRFVRLLLARGADPFHVFRITNLSNAVRLYEMTMLCEISTAAGRFAPCVIDLLIRWGAGVECIQHSPCRITMTREDGGKEVCRYSPLAYAILYAKMFRRRQHRAVAIALLRGGASLDAVATITVEDAAGAPLRSRSESIEWALGKRERREPLLVTNAHYLAFKAFLLSVHAAGGYRSFVIKQRRTCALVRHLALRDRATTRDGVLRFLARTGERGLFRRVMSYLPPPPPPPPPHVVYNIRVRNVATGEQTFFKIKSTTVLAKVFRAYAKVRGGPQHPYTAQWAFSLQTSPDVLIEGWQTGNDLGLAAGSIIDARLYAEHPVGLREQAVAAAAAADAARQYLEHLRADERFRGAEDAEEAIAHAAACGAWGLDWDAEEAVARAAACGLD
jgi:hypothetical protein